MNTTEIKSVTPEVTWVGVWDFDIRTFDVVMETKYGTTYNSYLIKAEKIALVETAKATFWDTYIAKIKQVCDPKDIAYIIVDHTEPDHSGSLVKLLDLAPNAVVVGSPVALRYLAEITNREFKSLAVKDGDTLSLGNKTLEFINAPNLHWPDSIYTYLREDKVLFTCDSFGAHFCHKEMFDDLVGDYEDAFKFYYTAILRPFSRFFLKAIAKVKTMDIAAICPGHGPILRSDWKRYVELSEKMSQEYVQLPQARRVFVGYVSAYGYTAQLAEKIGEGLSSCGLEVDLCDIEKMPVEELGMRIEQANGYVFGSSTINQNALPQIYTCFALLSPIRDRAKMAGAFGSYGWSGETRSIIEANIQTLKLNFVGDSYFIKFKPSQAELKGAFEYGCNFGEKMLAQVHG
ncbi:MAG: FprA family A-type flavoprotein [Bacteroidales bacterium]